MFQNNKSNLPSWAQWLTPEVQQAFGLIMNKSGMSTNPNDMSLSNVLAPYLNQLGAQQGAMPQQIGSNYTESEPMMNQNAANGFSPPILSQSNTQQPPSNNPAMMGSPLISQLRGAAEVAFPGNATMQQIALSQALLESGAMGTSGPSKLARENQNWFGIKGSGDMGSANLPTSEYMDGEMQNQNANFAQNSSLMSSFEQYKKLMSNPRYKGVQSAETLPEAFQALQSSGYATDPKYAAKLNKIYESYVKPLYES